ncbi:hypothetical protein JGU71_29130 [Antrihabitans sp. YC3-6]|uniref:Uncharacterized protein n=1 Tax=Antrihabitans stalagmiti TaxID=2799499 RepID=A0A934NXA4_9NOCA|nr:hypothetical protein [Antrihabitans stalagmiti]MBJ8342957.1 hypothetical protein [Antrihabitans stalagmiti]
MNHSHRTLTQLLITVSAVTLLLMGCGTDDRSPPSTEPSVVDTNSADTVAVEALARIFSWRPADEPQGGSLARARDLLGPTLLTVVDANAAASTPPRTSLQWAHWREAGARIDAFPFASAEPSGDTDPTRIQHRKIGIEQSVVYPDGDTELLLPTAVIATLIHTADGWRLDTYQ